MDEDSIKTSLTNEAEECPVLLQQVTTAARTKNDHGSEAEIATATDEAQLTPLDYSYIHQKEQGLLLEWFERQQQQQPRCADIDSLLLMRGQRGLGQLELIQTVLGENALLLKGSFDPFPVPYAFIHSVVEDFVTSIVGLNCSNLEQIRDSVIHHVGGSKNAALLRHKFPCLQEILGNAVADDDSESIQRFAFVLRRFFQAICCPKILNKKIVVICLNNVHWADPGSIDLIFNILKDASRRQGNLVVIGTCSDDDSHSLFTAELREVESRQGQQITKIELSNLSREQVDDLMARTLVQNDSQHLSALVYEQTKGNLLYIAEFLKWLQGADILYRHNGRWEWDVDELELKPCSLSEFLDYKLKKELSAESQEVLKVCACLGSRWNMKLVECILGGNVEQNLKEAVRIGALRASKDGYLFSHDCFREAAYQLAKDKELSHLEVGRRLWRKLNKEELEKQYCVILVAQFMAGKRLITRDKEKSAIALLCLHAGRGAAAHSAFRASASVLNFGIELLGQRGWRDEYLLMLSLHVAGGEMEMCSSNNKRANDLIEEILEHARCETDKVEAYATKMLVLGASERQGESIELGVKVLRNLGEEFPSRLCNARLMVEMNSVLSSLRRMTDEQFLRLPTMNDKVKLASVRILQTTHLHSLMTKSKFGPFIILKALKIFLGYGLSAMTAGCLVTFGTMCLTFKGDVEAAYRFGKLSLALLEKFNAIEYLPRVYSMFYTTIHAWKHPIRESLEQLKTGHIVGMYTGDFETSGICAKSYCLHALASGIPLNQIANEWVSYHDMLLSTGQQLSLAMTLPYIQAFHHFMGLTSDPLAKEGDLLDFDQALDDASRKGHLSRIMILRFGRMLVAYTFCDYDLAYEMAIEIRRFQWPSKIPPSFDRILFSFFCCLTELALTHGGCDRRKLMRSSRKTMKDFRKWADISPYNFLNKQFLLEAEYESLNGRKDKATKKYICAIALAKESRFLLDHAIANERAARHWLRHDDADSAKPYFLAACASYTDWGGHAKAARLLKEIEAIYPA